MLSLEGNRAHELGRQAGRLGNFAQKGIECRVTGGIFRVVAWLQLFVWHGDSARISDLVTESSMATLEREIQGALAQGELSSCATLVLRGYGPEILGYLLGRLQDETLAAEVFAMFAEDLWRSLPNLTLSATMRAYAYALARNAAHRMLDRQVRKDRKGVPLSRAEAWSRVAAEVRSATLPHMRSSVRGQVARLREQLQEEEQTLLTLRIDRELSWSEIALVFAGADADQAALHKESARLRKRFEATKLKLRKLAIEAGLLTQDTES